MLGVIVSKNGVKTGGEEASQHYLTAYFNPIFADNHTATVCVACGCRVFVALPHWLACVAFSGLATCQVNLSSVTKHCENGM